jgi:hypothetical protein
VREVEIVLRVAEIAAEAGVLVVAEAADVVAAEADVLVAAAAVDAVGVPAAAVVAEAGTKLSCGSTRIARIQQTRTADICGPFYFVYRFRADGIL